LQPLLVENIEEELDPVLDPVLERRLVKKGKSWVLQLADKEVRAGSSAAEYKLHASTTYVSLSRAIMHVMCSCMA
jgi:hypothetical protein